MRIGRGTAKGLGSMVTGTTNTIGLAFTHELAARGFSIVLHDPEGHSQLEVQFCEAFPARSSRMMIADAGMVS